MMANISLKVTEYGNGNMKAKKSEQLQCKIKVSQKI